MLPNTTGAAYIFSWSIFFLLNYSSNIKLKRLMWHPLIWRCCRSRTPYSAEETPVTPDPCFARAHWPGELARVLREQHYSLTMVKDLHYWRNNLAIGLIRNKIVLLIYVWTASMVTLRPWCSGATCLTVVNQSSNERKEHSLTTLFR